MLRRKAKVITVSGGKGGTGKSFVSVNLAVALAQGLPAGELQPGTVSNNRVLLFDADYHLSNDHLFLGIRQTAYLDRIVQRPGDLFQYITPTEYGVDLISFGGDDKRVNLTELKFNTSILSELKKLEAYYDWIIVDTGAGLSRMIINQIVFADKVLLVMNAEPTSLLDTYKLIKFVSLEAECPRDVFLCLNRVQNMEEAGAAYQKLTGTLAQFGIRLRTHLAGAVYADKKTFDIYISRGIPAVAAGDGSHFCKAFAGLAKSMQQGALARKVESFFERIYS